jgi:hypothetical protein
MNNSAFAKPAGGGAKAPRRWPGWLLLAVIVLLALAVIFIPAWLIQPFRPQSPRAVEVSYFLRRWSPVVTLAAAAAALALGVRLWRGKRSWWRRGLIIAAMLPLLTAAWLARQNHFEWMFNPLPNPAYARVGEASFVADTDMVMAVEINGDAVAYPVRQMAYHHVVHDVVGGTPITATY